jgi:zinc D-Ala-D-Ala carboxypeptidase
MFSWNRGTVRMLSTHFSTKEFTCRCGMCRDQRISKELITKIEEVRALYGRPITVTSGFRCPRHQAHLRGTLPEGHTAKGTSTHEMGQAADITGEDLPALFAACEKVFKAIGLAKTFYHVDLRNDKVRRWNY